ncbi:MAG: LytTR family DNA-binding domain-containing protein [Bacteroidia bacterium]|nr:LytTR family DNA-binding domain-containing protein [Bacteroidia bacterium]
MKYLIIDDEPIAHRIIEGYCAELPHLGKVGNAYNAFEASVIVAKQKVDLIFLDINMPKMTGFDWLKTLAQAPQIIVTTAYKEYALEGYELDIVDYLLKPFSFPRFLKAVNKLGDKDSSPEPIPVFQPQQSSSSFFLKGEKKHHQIHTKDILFVEAYGNYCKVYLQAEMILSHEKISNMEKLLPKENFLRVHKSFLVATDKIKLIQGNQIFIQEHNIPIGQTYRSRINQLLGGK